MWFLCAQVDHTDASLERNAFFFFFELIGLPVYHRVY